MGSWFTDEEDEVGTYGYVLSELRSIESSAWKMSVIFWVNGALKSLNEKLIEVISLIKFKASLSLHLPLSLVFIHYQSISPTYA